MKEIKDWLYTFWHVVLFVFLCGLGLLSMVLSIELVRSFRGN